MSTKSKRKIFGKRRATRWRSWLALQSQPFRRLGALVFRLEQARKSYNGLAPNKTDQDPDGRLCVGLQNRTRLGWKNVSPEYLSKRLTPCLVDPTEQARSSGDQRPPFPDQFNALQTEVDESNPTQRPDRTQPARPVELPQLRAVRGAQVALPQSPILRNCDESIKPHTKKDKTEDR